MAGMACGNESASSHGIDMWPVWWTMFITWSLPVNVTCSTQADGSCPVASFSWRRLMATLVKGSFCASSISLIHGSPVCGSTQSI